MYSSSLLMPNSALDVQLFNDISFPFLFVLLMLLLALCV